MTSLEVKIRDTMPELNPAEQKVASFILENINKVVSLPIEELAERSNVSKASWVRFSKRFDFSGFREFKRELLNDLGSSIAESRTEHETDFSDIKQYDNEKKYSEIVDNSIRAIQDTYTLLDVATIESVANCISQAKTVRIFGFGASGVVAEDLCYKLLRIGISAMLFKDYHIDITLATNTTKRDVGIFVSHSGRTTELLELLDICKEHRAATIAITKYGNNPLSENSDYVIYTSAMELEKRSGAMSSRIAQLLVVDFLFAAIAGINYEKIENKLEESYRNSKKHRRN